MPVDDSSSQDATLIDDDLVSALGFEPVTNGNGQRVESGLGRADTATRDHDDERATDPIASDPDTSDVEVTDGDGTDGYGVVGDDTAGDVTAATGVVEVDVDQLDVDHSEIQQIDLDDGGANDERVDDAPIADPPIADTAVPVDGDDVVTDPVAARTAGGSGSFFDLDLDDDGATEAVDTEAIDTEAVETEDADDVSDADDQSDVSVMEVIDLDRVDADAVSDSAVSGSAVSGSAVSGSAEAGVAAADDDLVDAAPSNDAFAGDAFADTVFAKEVSVDDADVDVAVADHTDLPDHDTTAPVSVTEGALLTEPFDVESTEQGDLAAVAAAPAGKSTAVKRRRRLRARKSRRVIRHIDPWSVLTFSVLFHMVVFAALLLSSVLVWNAAIASGMVENVESFIQELGDYETFTINADVMFRAAIVIAGMLTLASSVLVVLLTVVFNLISDLVGGIRVTVIEEETVRVPIDKNRSAPSSE